MKREELKDTIYSILFRQIDDGSADELIEATEEIAELFPLPPAEGAIKVQWSGYGELGNISQKPLQPTAVGAEENIIYHNLTQPFRQILQSVALHGYDIVFAERDCVKCATEFATLHAQRLAEEMVEEKLKNAPKNCPKAAQCAHVEGGMKCPPNVICPI